VSPRLAQHLPLAPGDVRLVADGWQDTAVVLDDVPDGAMNAFDGAPLEVGAGRVSLAALCGTLPIALAWADTTMRAKVPLYP
jgi:(1->4)-alpha-D-glucan 1-alpha-D-glucosylmutase